MKTKQAQQQHTPGRLLYKHTTTGGAKYLCDKFIEWKHNGRSGREGIFEGAQIIVRLDGEPYVMFRGAYAAAPDLLEHLTRLVNICTHPKATKAEMRTIAQEARKVLAKIGGES